MNILLSRRLQATKAFHSRAFSIFWVGQTISQLGDGAFSTALAVEVLLLTHSSIAMGTFLLAQIVPGLIFLLFGGVAADRLPRRYVLLFADAGRAAVVLFIALLAWFQLLHIEYLFVLAIIFGFVRSFFSPAFRAIMPELVAREQLASANGLVQFSGQLGLLIGPLLGAGFIALGGSPASAFAFDGFTFVISVASLYVLRGHVAPSQTSTGEKRSISTFLRDIREGFLYVRNSTWLLWTIIVPAFCNVAYAGAMVVTLPRLVYDVYGSGAWLLGTLATIEGIGAISGALFVGQVRLRHRGIIAFLGNILAGVATIAFGLPLARTIAPVVALIAAFFVGFGLSLLQTIWVTLLHEFVPQDKLGRVSSVDLLGSLSLFPLGYLLSGWTSDRFGPASVFLAGGIIIVGMSSIPLFLRGIRSID